MNAQYERLLTAAEEKFDVSGPVAVSRALTLAGLRVTEQQMGNWKSRGVPGRTLVQAAHLLGVIPQWLATGTGPKHGMITTVIKEANRSRPSVEKLMSIVEKIDDAGVNQLIGQARLIALEYPIVKETPLKSSG